MVAPADPAATGGPGSGDANTRAENERSADALFESRSLDEIREVRARAARDAEAKDEELRQRVGSSYRDAIATADCVLEMEATAARATETLDEATRVLAALPDAVASIEKGASVSPSRETASRDDDALYGAGTRVKFLVDTPEKIWGSLEARDRVSAARRFLAARDVLSSLGEDDSARDGDVSARRTMIARAFPIVKQQAPLLESFRAQISRAARAGLADAPTSARRLGSATPNLALDAADALAALVAAEDLDAERALRVFLQTRRAWVRAALRGADGTLRAKGKGRKGRKATDARDVARALAEVCREARRVPRFETRLCVARLYSDAAKRANARPASALRSTATPPFPACSLNPSAVSPTSIAPTHAIAVAAPFDPGRAGNDPPTAQASVADDAVFPAFSPRSDATADHVSPPSVEAAAYGDVASSSSPARKCRRSTPSAKNSAGSRCVAGAPGARASANGADQGLFPSPESPAFSASPSVASSIATRLEAHTAGLEASLLDRGATHAQK